MKTPRITDFDQDAKIPTLKSSLDSMPSIQKHNPIRQIPPHQGTAPIIDHREQQSISKTINKRPTAQSSKRPFVR